MDEEPKPEQVQYVEINSTDREEEEEEEEEYEEDEEEEEEEDEPVAPVVVPVVPKNPWEEELTLLPPRYIKEKEVFLIPPHEPLVPGGGLLAHTDFLLNYARLVISKTTQKSIEYSSDSESRQIYIRVSATVTTFMRCGVTGWTIMTSNILLHSHKLCGMNYILGASILLDHFLQLFGDDLKVFCPKSLDIAPGYPTLLVKCETLSFESSDELFETHYLPRWMPHINRNDDQKCINVGCAFTKEDMERCIRIYNKYFWKRVEGWYGGSHIHYMLANWLRGRIPNTYITQTNIPYPHIIRWIKGWMSGYEGYTHITQIRYHNPSFYLNERALNMFDDIREDYDAGEHKVVVRNPQGTMGLVQLSLKGQLSFDVVPSGPRFHMSSRDLDMEEDDLVDDPSNYQNWFETDWIDYSKNLHRITSAGPGNICPFPTTV